MKNLYYPICFVFLVVFSSCDALSNMLGGGATEEKYPNTTVMATKGYYADVKFSENDSVYTIRRYWTAADGRLLYKLKEEPFKHGRLHGTKTVWNERGDTLEYSIWEDGIQRDSMLVFYPEYPQQLAQIIYYLPNGNKAQETYFHLNGVPRTDTILYQKGMREGPVNFYDTLGKVTETYFYKNDNLIGVKIYKEKYEQVASRALALQKQIKQDSINKAEKLRLSGAAEGTNKNNIQRDASQNKDYKGNASTSVDAAVW